jgi:hypothetical protein
VQKRLLRKHHIARYHDLVLEAALFAGQMEEHCILYIRKRDPTWITLGTMYNVQSNSKMSMYRLIFLENIARFTLEGYGTKTLTIYNV